MLDGPHAGHRQLLVGHVAAPEGRVVARHRQDLRAGGDAVGDQVVEGDLPADRDPQPDARRVDGPRSGARHEVPRPVGVLGQQPEERPPRQVLTEGLDPPLVGAVDDTDPGLPRPAPSSSPCPPGRPAPCPARSARPTARAARSIAAAASGLRSGSMSEAFSGHSTTSGRGRRPAATSAASCSVTRTWLSSTARRCALKSRPSRGTLPCTAAIVTVRTGRAGGREQRGQRTGRQRDERDQRGHDGGAHLPPGQAPPGLPQREAGQHGDERQQRRPADGGHGQQRPVGLAEGDAPPREAAERHAAPAAPPRRPTPPPPTPAPPRSRDTVAIPAPAAPTNTASARRERQPRHRADVDAGPAQQRQRGSPARTARRSRTRRGRGGRARSRRAARTRAAPATTGCAGRTRGRAAPLRRRRPWRGRGRSRGAARGAAPTAGHGRSRGVGDRGGHGASLRAVVHAGGHGRVPSRQRNAAFGTTERTERRFRSHAAVRDVGQTATRWALPRWSSTPGAPVRRYHS